jgi:tRNA nucleotidyltransferase (CCA-adding enzyme)
MAKQLLSDVLSAIKPGPRQMKEEVDFAEGLLKRIGAKAPKGCDVVLTGSMAKRTFLRDRRDIDIFVLFDRSFPREKLEDAIKKLLSKAFPKVGYQLSYAEHPYARFHYEGRRIDLVPAYKITEAAQRISAVDRSVLHTRFIKRSLKAAQRDDVLLLKQFLRAGELYGAEIKIEGYSGYLCELLILKYGGFMKLARAAAKWKAPVFIDISKLYKKKEVPEAMERFGHLTVIDPTDKDRNVAAAVSEKNMRGFIKLCKAFLKKPTKERFLRKPETFEQKVSKVKGKTGFLLSMPRPNVVDDVLWGQLHRMMRQMEDSLEDFTPKKLIADDTQHLVRIAIFLDKEKLPPKMLIQGPPLEMKEHLKKFRKKHPKARFTKKNGKLCAEVRRPVTDARAAIKRFLKEFSTTKSHLGYPEELYVLEHIKPRKLKHK